MGGESRESKWLSKYIEVGASELLCSVALVELITSSIADELGRGDNITPTGTISTLHLSFVHSIPPPVDS